MVAAAIEKTAIISAVNFSEVVKKMVERGIDHARVSNVAADADIEIVPFDEEQAIEAAKLFAPTREHGMSFGDRACLALAALRKLPVYTTERKMDQLGLPVRVRLLRHS